MRVSCQSFWMQKASCSADEYEDAFAPPGQIDETVEIFKCAVADGATETSFAALWAQLLVNDYVQAEQGIDKLQSAWREKTSGLQLPWYAEEKLASGAFAALVGLTLRTDESGKGIWQAKAIGDSCLFHIRGDELLKAFPLTKWQEFNSNPALISSVESNNKDLEKYRLSASDEWQKGDLFYLMSDAISCWFLKCYEQTRDTVTHLAQITEQNVFADVIQQQRSLNDTSGSPLMKNDDVTLMRVTPTLE